MSGEIDYHLFKFSDYMKKEYLTGKKFRAIRVSRDEIEGEVDCYYVYPLLSVLDGKERDTVVEQLFDFYIKGKNPKNSIGLSTSFFDSDKDCSNKWVGMLYRNEFKPMDIKKAIKLYEIG